MARGMPRTAAIWCSAADPANGSQMVVAIGDLNTSHGFNPDTISNLLSSGFIDTWEHTNNPLRKPDVEWILVNAALLGDALVSNTSADASCSAETADGNSSDHRAFFVDIEFGAEFGLAAKPPKRTFGEVEVGKAVLRKVTVMNHARQDIDISAINITGRHRARFTLPAGRDACSSTVLTPQQSCRLQVRFEPTAKGQKRANAVINSNDPNGGKIRVKLRGTAVADRLATGGVESSSRADGQNRNPDELVLINGNILTMDRFDRVVSGVRIRDGRFVEVGDDVSVEGSEDQVNDLGRRTVTPGLIDTHIHYFRDAHIPGHLLSAIERVFTIPDLLRAVTERAATVPAGEFITVVGRFNPSQFAEEPATDARRARRRRAESRCVPANGLRRSPPPPTLWGRSTSRPTGSSSTPAAAFNRGQTPAPVQALFDEFTNAEALRTVSEYMRFSASLGLTMVQNYSGCGGLGPLPAGTLCEDNFLDLWRRAGLLLRIRSSVGGTGTQTDASGIYQVVLDAEAALQELEDSGRRRRHVRFLRDRRIRGRQLRLPRVPPSRTPTGRSRERGWSLRQHSISTMENEAHIAAFEAVDSAVPIAEMRWAIEHVFSIGPRPHPPARTDRRRRDGSESAVPAGRQRAPVSRPPRQRHLLVGRDRRLGHQPHESLDLALPPWSPGGMHPEGW